MVTIIPLPTIPGSRLDAAATIDPNKNVLSTSNIVSAVTSISSLEWI
jgi:hypothetical protein